MAGVTISDKEKRECKAILSFNVASSIFVHISACMRTEDARAKLDCCAIYSGIEASNIDIKAESIFTKLLDSQPIEAKGGNK